MGKQLQALLAAPTSTLASNSSALSMTCFVDGDCAPLRTGPCSESSPENCIGCITGSSSSSSLLQLMKDVVHDQIGFCGCVPYDPVATPGAQSSRCALCTYRTYFKSEDGLCSACPQIALYQYILLGVFVLGAAYGLYKITQLGVSMALFNVAIDYFQILAMFQKSQIDWPAELKTLFTILSVFNFNIDLLPPECSFPTIEYFWKWIAIESVPVLFTIIFLVYNGIMVLSGMIKRQSVKDVYVWNHQNTFIQVGVSVFYLVYMFLLKIQLDVFSCYTTTPPDGYQYAQFTSLKDCGGLCKCWEPGSLQMRLFPLAVLAFIVYSLGFPIYLFHSLRKNKKLILQDQILRAYGTQNKNNVHYSIPPNVEDVKIRFSRLYARFHPDFYWWSLIILIRKMGICSASLVYSKNPTFQFSLILLISFTGFILQLKYKPYLSERAFETFIAEHHARITQYKNYQNHYQRMLFQEAQAVAFGKKASAGGGATVAQATQQQQQQKQEPSSEALKKHALQFYHRNAPLHDEIEEKIQRELSFGRNKRIANWDDIKRIKILESARESINWLLDYNTIESVLLACSVLVCLFGIIFQSTSPVDNTNYSIEYANERHSLTYVCLVLVSSSIVYIVFNISQEINNKLQCCNKYLRRNKFKTRLSMADERGGGGDDDGDESIVTATTTKKSASPLYSKVGTRKLEDEEEEEEEDIVVSNSDKKKNVNDSGFDMELNPIYSLQALGSDVHSMEDVIRLRNQQREKEQMFLDEQRKMKERIQRAELTGDNRKVTKVIKKIEMK